MKVYVYRALLSLSLCLSVPAMSWADLKQGIRYWQADEYNHAISELLPEAKKGNALAQFYLSLSLIKSKTIYDVADAKKWMFKSAESGNPYAMWNLGTKDFCIFQLDMDQDCDSSGWKAKSITRWKELAKKNNGDAIAVLARYLPENDDNIFWMTSNSYANILKKAISMGSGYATILYSDWAQLNTPLLAKMDPITKQHVFHYLVKAANQGYLPAMEELGGDHYGIDFKDILGDKKSFFWTKKCAMHGDINCVLGMYPMYLGGIGVKKDLTQAYKWMLIVKSKKYYNPNVYILTAANEKDFQYLSSHLTAAQKSLARKEATQFVRTHLPDYGKNPLFPFSVGQSKIGNW